MNFGDKTTLECLRLELSEKLKLIDKQFNKNTKLVELNDNGCLASYRVIIDKKIKYILQVKQDLSIELIREYNAELYFNLFKSAMQIIKGNFSDKIDKRFFRKQRNINYKIPRIYLEEPKENKVDGSRYLESQLEEGIKSEISTIENILTGKFNYVNENQLSLFRRKKEYHGEGGTYFAKVIMY